jgi:hypothetical protein
MVDTEAFALDEEQASRVLATPLAEFAHCDSR